VLAAAIVGVLAVVGFAAFERRARHPLFDVRVLVRRRVFAGAFGIWACSAPSWRARSPRRRR
jgi:hypothetical protein